MTPRVLIVEDEAITALDIATELRGLGYEVCGIVDTSAEALTVAARERPGLVLMDVRLADGGDGIEAARHIRQQQDTAVVFLTAHSDESTLARALDVSPDGYLIKPFRARDLKVAIDVAFAKQARAASMREMALVDALTGLANRRRMDEVLETESARCRREGRPVCLLAVDVDCFKAYNDAHGHPAGDRCLRVVAAALRGCVRPGDTVCRWGGEEFLAVLPDADRHAGGRIAAAMVEAIRDLQVPHRASRVAPIVTVSVGLADRTPAMEDSIAALVARVDAALYAAKRSGRNRFSAAGEPLADVRATMIEERIATLHCLMRRVLASVDSLACLLHDRDTDVLRRLAAGEGTAGPARRLRLADSPTLRRLVDERRSHVITDLDVEPAGREEPFAGLRAAGYRSAHVVPLFDREPLTGFLVLASRDREAFGPEAGGQLAAYVNLAALLLCRESVGEQASADANAAASMPAGLPGVEHALHLHRVAHFSRLIARQLASARGLPDEFVSQVFLFAPLHDVGKAGISATILLKPGRLSPEERDVMASHVPIGTGIVESLIVRLGLENVAGIDVLRNIVAGHHERLDGSGYPHGLTGEAIPLESRIVAVADIFDALTSRRVYKDAWPVAAAFAALESLAADGKIDAECVAALRAGGEECREIVEHRGGPGGSGHD
jgi:diguanylate cyclase (GGDEF)-like protein